MVNQEACHWLEAQKIAISIDLIATTKKHLQFLEAVDNYGNLYDGPILEKAIFRYKFCWLPLLAKHTEVTLPEFQLVVPLDCEWIWHCHRLNPIRYMEDCEKLFGRILDPGCVVVSSIEGKCTKQTKEIWNTEYPEEPYELDFNDNLNKDTQRKLSTLPTTNYDLIPAVNRQSSFYREVSLATFKDDLYLEEATMRYKGFLHLLKMSIKMNSKNDFIPTYDIDLMWHSHQLHPISYRKDVLALVGRVLHHDDSDCNQNTDGKLKVVSTTTTKQWEEMFGFMYLKALSKYIAPTIGMDGEKVVAKCGCPVQAMEGEKFIAKCGCPVEGMEGEKFIAKCGCPVEGMEGEKFTGICYP